MPQRSVAMRIRSSPFPNVNAVSFSSRKFPINKKTAIKTKLTTELVDGPNKILKVAVDNGASIKLEGFVFRVYNTGETTVDVLDTNNPSSGLATDPPGDYTIASNGIKTFVLDYNEVMVSTPVKVGVKPRITVSGQQKECDEITKSL